MSLGKRIGILAVLCLAISAVCWGGLLGAVYMSGGVATVHIEERESGTRLFIPVPAAVLDAASAAPAFLPHEDLLEIQAELGEWGPVARAMMEALEDAPDFTLVEVQDGDTYVKIRKEGGTFRVIVDDEDVTVKISMPVRTLSRSIGRLVS